MSPRTDKDPSLLLYFLPSWCLGAIHDPHPSPGKVIRPLNLWAAKLRRWLTTFLPNLLLAWVARAVCLARVPPELHSPLGRPTWAPTFIPKALRCYGQRNRTMEVMGEHR